MSQGQNNTKACLSPFPHLVRIFVPICKTVFPLLVEHNFGTVFVSSRICESRGPYEIIEGLKSSNQQKGHKNIVGPSATSQTSMHLTLFNNHNFIPGNFRYIFYELGEVFWPPNSDIATVSGPKNSLSFRYRPNTKF